jgi:hypothetical protein
MRPREDGAMQSGQEGQPLEMLGMAEETMLAYSESLVTEQAAALAEATGMSFDEAYDSPQSRAVRAAMAYTTKLLVANNAYLTQHLLRLGVIAPGAGIELQEDFR